MNVVGAKAAEARVAELSATLAEYPSEPLPNDQAQAKLEDALLKMKDEEDSGKRVASLFRLKMLLVGSKLETKADGLWKKEQRARQAAIDRAAPAVYKEVSTKIRSQPDAHDENVRLLSEALGKVAGSRYEATVRGLLEKEKKAKADADARAAEESF